MAIISCSECGKQVSDKAKKCPNCGHPINLRMTTVRQTPVRQPQQQTQIIVNQQNSNGTGTAGFVFALLALFLSWIPIFGWILWLFGLLFSFFGLFKTPRGLAVVGFIISIIDLIILFSVVAGTAALFSGIFA